MTDEFKPQRFGEIAPFINQDSMTEALPVNISKDEVPEHFSVPVGEWIDVPKGMVAAPNTVVDSAGTLRDSKDNSIAVWHNGKRGVPPCDFKVKSPEQITYVGGAPWCPRCAEYNRLSAVLGPNPGVAQ